MFLTRKLKIALMLTVVTTLVSTVNATANNFINNTTQSLNTITYEVNDMESNDIRTVLKEDNNSDTTDNIQFKEINSTSIEFVNNSLSTVGDDSEATTKTKSKKQKIDRGIKTQTFIPKGTLFFGGTVSYSNLESTDYKFIILDNLKANSTLISAKAFIGYAFANNVAAGVAFDYSRNLIKIDNVDLNLSEDLNFAVTDYYSIQQVYTASAFLRTYINIGNSKRFGMFNDIKVYFGGGQGKVTSGVEGNSSFTGTYEKINKLGIVLQPGISVFATDFMAVEASIGILGVEYSRTEQITNQVYQGSVESFSASFKLNLLSIGLGLSFYF